MLKLTSTIVIIMMLTQSALANEIKFTKEVAQQLAGELQFCRDTHTYEDKLITILNLKVEKYYSLSTEYKNKIGLLELDKADLKTRGDRFEKVYTTCTDDLNKCKQEKPSRLVWGSIGFGLAVILGIATVFAIKN